MNGQRTTNNIVNNNTTFRSNRTLTGSEVVSKVKKRYKYICYDKNGKQVKGSFDAFRRMDVESFLSSQGYKILEIKETKISTSIKFIQYFFK